MILGADGRPLQEERNEREYLRDSLREVAWYRDHVLAGAKDHDILTRAGEGSRVTLWLLPPADVEQRLSETLGAFERERYGRFVPERAVYGHNVLVKAFAIHVRTRPMPV